VRKAFATTAWIFAIAGVLLAVLHIVAGNDASATLFLAVTVVFALVLVISARVHQPDTAVWVFALAVASTSIIGQIIDNQLETNDPARAVSEFFFLAVQLLLVVGLTTVVRRRLGQDSAAVLGDGIIVGLGAWLVVWVLLLQPSLAATSETTLVTALRGATLGASIIVLFLLATLLFSDMALTTAVSFVGIAIALALTGDLIYAVMARGDAEISESIANAPYIASLMFASAGFLHPTIRDITKPGKRRATPPLMTRLVTTTLSLVVPIIVLAVTDAEDTTDRIVRTVSVAVLAIAATARIIQSVRANVRTQTTLLRSAQTDALTGLPNRSMMLEHINVALQESWHTNKQPTVLFIDVDRFKNINDSLGHSAGDDVLTSVASRLINAVPERAVVGRISGDEFVVLDPDTQSATQSVMLAEKVLDAFREPLGLSQGDMFISASVGVAFAPTSVSLSADDLLRHADTAMYRAKDAGRNCIALFDDSMLEQVTQRLSIETALYRALERRELRLVHQPIVDIDLGIVIGFEALMRWDRGDGASVSPAEFIPIAEETGTIVPLGSWALLDALTQLRHWIDAEICQPHTTMSVNVSPRQLHDPNFVSVVSEALSRSGIPADQVWLEVTEGVMISEPEQALSSLRRLNALGVRVAVDDFGTGYSSLSTLQRFPIQRIKIDRAFVNGIATDAGARSIVRTIIAMATSLGLDIVAEGVENTAQLRALAELQCHKAQGYLISHPVGVDAVPSAVAHLENIDDWLTRDQ
jgi:diguanylate cyclase (GGDEF)-like protein